MLTSKPVKLIVAFVPLQTAAACETPLNVGAGFIVAVTAVLDGETLPQVVFLASA